MASDEITKRRAARPKTEIETVQKRDPIYRLPPFAITAVPVPLSQSLPWGHTALGIPEVWRQTRGAGIRACLLDTGVDVDHIDLAAGIRIAVDFTGSRHGARDINSHGTWVVGMVGARDNNAGIVGIAPDCDLYSGKVLGDWIAAGLDWAASAGCRVVSMSLGSPQADPQITAAIERFTSVAGRFVIAAAGNDGYSDPTSTNYPAALPQTIAVAAIDKSGAVADFSSRGPQVDIAAPGVDLLSTVPGNKYATMSGTSMACPIVAGVVVLALADDDDIETTSELRQKLKSSAVDIDEAGEDISSGAGLINPDKLLAGDESGEVPVGDFREINLGSFSLAYPVITSDGREWLGLRYK